MRDNSHTYTSTDTHTHTHTQRQRHTHTHTHRPNRHRNTQASTSYGHLTIIEEWCTEMGRVSWRHKGRKREMDRENGGRERDGERKR